MTWPAIPLSSLSKAAQKSKQGLKLKNNNAITERTFNNYRSLAKVGFYFDKYPKPSHIHYFIHRYKI